MHVFIDDTHKPDIYKTAEYIPDYAASTGLCTTKGALGAIESIIHNVIVPTHNVMPSCQSAHAYFLSLTCVPIQAYHVTRFNQLTK